MIRKSEKDRANIIEGRVNLFYNVNLILTMSEEIIRYSPLRDGVSIPDLEAQPPRRIIRVPFFGAKINFIVIFVTLLLFLGWGNLWVSISEIGDFNAISKFMKKLNETRTNVSCVPIL